MQKLKAKMTIMCSTNYENRDIEIEVEDAISSCTFLKLRIKPEDFTAMLGRLSNVEVDMEVASLDRVGKKMIMDILEFEMPEYVSWKDKQKSAREQANKKCPVGWVFDSGFNSQDSFFMKDDKAYARCTIRKWE